MPPGEGRKELLLRALDEAGLRADRQAALQHDVLVDLQRHHRAGVGVIVEAVGHRVRIHVVVRRQLGLDVGQRDIAPDADIHALEDSGDIDFAIHHRHVIARELVPLLQLVA